MYIHFISSTNNGDNVTRQYNYISFQEAEEIDNLKYTTINTYKICVLHVILYYMYIFSKEKQLNTEHGVQIIDISIYLVTSALEIIFKETISIHWPRESET